MDGIRKGRVLGRGANGTVYLATDAKDGVRYALKVEKILPGDETRATSGYRREIDFAEAVANRHPDHFMTLRRHWVDPACKHTQPIQGGLEKLPAKVREQIRRLRDSPLCGLKLWSLVDTDMAALLRGWKTTGFRKDVFRGLLVQLVYALCLVRRGGYAHHDVHLGNVALKRTPHATVEVRAGGTSGATHRIPTHGYLVQLIDFGFTARLNAGGERDVFQTDMYEVFCVLFELMSAPWERMAKRRGLGKDWVSEYSVSHIPAADRLEMRAMLPPDVGTAENERCLVNRLFKALRYERWQRLSLGPAFKRAVPPRDVVPVEVLLSVATNLRDPEALLLALLALLAPVAPLAP